MYLLLYIVGILVYSVLPLPLQIPFLILNAKTADPIPLLDEIIMCGSTLRKLNTIEEVLDWIEDHVLLTFIIVAVAIIILVKIF